jgi:uncharacterized protein YjbJ (UPF0337 family)
VSQDDIRYEAKDLEGQAKDTVDDRTEDEVLEAEGKGDQATANVKQTGGKAQDAVRDVRDGVREAYESGS